jgi:hypothetical protein
MRPPREYATAMADPTGDAIEQLYAVPPGAFTRERKAKVAALRKAGHDTQARAVQQLRRPSAALWASNQLARAEPERLAAWLDAVERVRRTQLQDPRATGEALQRQRAELETLVARAADIMREAGARTSPESLRRIANTLLGAAVDPALAGDLRRGRLTAELPAPGFEVLAGAQPGPPLRLVRGGKGRGQPERADATQARRADAARARQQAQDAQRQHEREAAARRREADDLAAAAARADRELRELERQLADARARRRSAQKAAAKAAAAAARAERRPGHHGRSAARDAGDEA